MTTSPEASARASEPWCKGQTLAVLMSLHIYAAGQCRCVPRMGPTWCQGGEPWTPARVADLTWGRMHL